MSRIPGLIPLLNNIILGNIRQSVKNKKPKKRIVHLSEFLLIIGIIGTLPFLILSVILLFSDELRVFSIVFFIFSLLGGSMIIGFINCRIYYDDDGFTHKNFFGIKRKYTYDRVTAIKENLHEKILYVGKRRVMIDEFAVGGREFITLVKKKYHTMHDRKSLPRIYKSKFDIFNGNINDSTGIIFAYIFVSVCLVGLVAFVLYLTLVPINILSEISEEQVNFISCEAMRDEVVLKSEDNQIYKIRFTDGTFDTQAVEAVCNGEKNVTVYSEYIHSKYEESFNSIMAIEYNGNYVLSFDDTKELHIQEYWVLNIIMGLILLSWIWFVVMSIMVGRNPKKFKKRFVNLFFKDEQVRCYLRK